MAASTKDLQAKVAIANQAMVPARIEKDIRTWYMANDKKLMSLVGGNKEKVALHIAATFAQINKIPRLIECAPDTLHQCIIYSMAMNLLPGIMNECYFLPFKNNGKMEATFVPGYQGLVKLAYNSGFVTRIGGHVVWEADEFDYNPATETIFHKIFNGPEKDRGQRVCVYSAIKNRFGEIVYAVKSAEFVSSIKNRSKASKSSFSPWNSEYASDIDAMWLKTAFKQNVKWIPKSTTAEGMQLGKALDLDNRADTGESQAEILLSEEISDVQQMLERNNSQDILTDEQIEAMKAKRENDPA